MLHDIILAYARRIALTTNDMLFKDQLLRIRTERHDTTSAVKDNLERCVHLRGKALGILNWEISHNQWNTMEDSQNLLHVTTYMLPLHNIANIAKEMPNRFLPRTSESKGNTH